MHARARGTFICLALVALGLTNVEALAGCIDRVVVRPTGRLRPTTTVALEIRILTSDGPANLEQPTVVTQDGNVVTVDIYAAGGPLQSPDEMFTNVELGTFTPGPYTFHVFQHDTTGWSCSDQVVNGSFCVDTADCDEQSCTCQVFVPSYSIVSLGTFGGFFSWANALNDAGQVVGRAEYPQGEQHPFLWESGSMTDLGLPPGRSTCAAKDINDLGVVCGGCCCGDAVVWDHGTITKLPHLTGAQTGDTGAYAINNAGQVVGTSLYSGGGGAHHAFLWENGQITDLSLLTGVPWYEARGINNAGQIVGQGVLWDGSAVTMLGSLGGPATRALGLNDQGQVVGTSTRPGSKYWQAFLWSNGTMIDIGALGNFFSSEARAINNAGEVVGPGFIYDAIHGVRLLRDLIDVDSGWFDLVAEDINNNGQICGYGDYNGEWRAFLMTPVSQQPQGTVPATSPTGLVVMTLMLMLAGATVLSRRTAA